MIENFNLADSENIKSNNKIKESESIQNLLVIIYFEKLNNKISLSFLYLTSVYLENIYKNSSLSILKKILEKK